MTDRPLQPVADRELDTSGLNCPLPILKAKKALAEMQAGQVLKVVATDPGAPHDFQSFCKQTGHELIGEDAGERGAGPWTFLMRRRA